VKFSVCLAAMRADTVLHAIRSVQAQSLHDWELIVVGREHNVALREVVEHAARSDSRIRLVQVVKPGLSHARNAAVAVANGECVAMIDDDCEADSEWLAVLAQCFGEISTPGVVGGALLSPDVARGWFTWCPSYAPAEASYDPVATPRRPPAGCDWIGANFALRKSVFYKVGAFDEVLGAGTAFGAGEEVDYKLRLEAAGVVMRTTPRAVVRHTFGVRKGIRPMLSAQRAYARGNGALAAKLTLMGDERGLRWFNKNRRMGWNGLRQGRLHRIPLDLRRLWLYTSAYRECMRRYAVDEHGLLRPREAVVGALNPLESPM
jgi:GT2 family glycosyltransferase